MTINLDQIVSFLGIITPVVTGVGLLIRLDMTSKNHTAQIEAASKNQTAQHEALGKRFDSLEKTVVAISGDSREHGARLNGLDDRMDRNEKDVEWLRRGMGVGLK